MLIKDICWYCLVTYPKKITTYVAKQLANKRVQYSDLHDIPIICINLAKRKDKRRFMERQAKRTNLNIQFFQALTIEPLQRSRLVRKGLVALEAKSKARNNQLTNKEIGCFLSHMAIWDTLLNSNHDATLVLEDDAKLNVSKKELSRFLKRIPKKADIYTFNLRHAKRKILNCNTLKITNSMEGMTAYVITKEGAEKLMTKLQINEAVDEYVSKKIKSKQLNVYGSTKDLFTETSTKANIFSYRFKSDIQNH